MWEEPDVADRLERQVAFHEAREFSEAWRRSQWKGRAAHLAVIRNQDELRWLGRAQGGKSITNRDRIVKVSEMEELPPLPVHEFERLLPKRHREALHSYGILTPAAGLAIVEALKSILPDYGGLIDKLQRAEPVLFPAGHRGEALNEQRDGLGLLLEIAEMDRAPLRRWSIPPVGVPFLAGIEQKPALEDSLIAHDLERFGSWAQVPQEQIAWRTFTNGHKRLFVMNANRTPVERTLGVDVVYFNERNWSGPRASIAA